MKPTVAEVAAEPKFLVGSRVRTKLRSPEAYALLNERAGVVEDFKACSMNGDHLSAAPWYGPAYLVRLDGRAVKWWAHQTPSTTFWFAEGDLVAEGGPVP